MIREVAALWRRTENMISQDFYLLQATFLDLQKIDRFQMFFVFATINGL